MCLSLTKAFIQWVCKQRLKTLWQELRGRNLWLWDWAGWLNRPHARHANSTHQILSFLGDLAKPDYKVEKPILFPTSLENFAQVQIFRNETGASKRLGNNLNLLTPTIPRTSLPGANNWNWSRAKVLWSSQEHYTYFTSNLHSSLSFDLRNPHLFFLIYNKYILGRLKI